jgi:anti-sigma-K factor RskA
MTPERHQLAEYLLGRLPAGEAGPIADRLFSEEDLLNEMEEVERDLLDAYARGRLSKADGLAVESASMTSELRREKLRFAIAMAGQKRKAQRYWLAAAAAAVVVCLTGAAVYAYLQSESRAVRIGKTRAENAPSVAFLLSPLQRGDSAEQFSISSKTEVVRLTFAAPAGPATEAQVRVKTQAGVVLLEQRNVRGDVLPDGGVYFSVWLAASSLPAGAYTAEVTALNGTPVDYAFRVTAASQ